MLTRTQLTELVDAMDRTLDAGGSTTAMQHTATRHREILADYTRDFKRTQTSLREAEQRANLLGSVREEISAFRQSTTSSATEQLLSERGKIDSSNRMTDDILGCAESPHRLGLIIQASVRDALRVSTATSGAAGRGLAHGRDRDAAAGDQLAHRDDQLAPTTRLDGPRQCRGRLHALPVVYRVWEMNFLRCTISRALGSPLGRRRRIALSRRLLGLLSRLVCGRQSGCGESDAHLIVRQFMSMYSQMVPTTS